MRSKPEAFGSSENIYRLAEELKIQERNVIDFSTPVNPLKISKKVKAEIRKHLKYLHNHPDPDEKRVVNRLAQHYDLDPDMVICGNGRTELLCLISRVLKPLDILIPEPSFDDYESVKAFTCQQSHVKKYLLEAEDDFALRPTTLIHTIEKESISSQDTVSSIPAPSSGNIIIAPNPNSLTGKCSCDDILKIAATALQHRQYLIVDEAFIDFHPKDSIIHEVKNNPYLIVLRSMSYFYALAGLRIGFSVCSPDLAKELAKNKQPMTVNHLAQRAVIIALKDKAYAKETFRVLAEEKQFLERSFKKLGITFFPSDVNYYLLQIPNAREICHQLQKRALLVWNYFEYTDEDSYIRVAVKSHRENTILIKALNAILQNSN